MGIMCNDCRDCFSVMAVTKTLASFLLVESNTFLIGFFI